MIENLYNLQDLALGNAFLMKNFLRRLKMNYTQRLIELVFERTDLTVETNTDEIWWIR